MFGSIMLAGAPLGSFMAGITLIPTPGMVGVGEMLGDVITPLVLGEEA